MKVSRRRDISYPFYMEFFYNKIYGSASACAKNDSSWRCQMKMFGQYKKMVNTVTAELKKGANVCQLGINFGNLIDEVALAIGSSGIYDIVDINPLEIKRISNKYGDLYKQITLINDNAVSLKSEAIRDNVICFMLLSMIPDSHKKKVIDNALSMLKPEGKAIFIDWAKPKKYNPLGWILKFYQRLYNPLAEGLQEKSLKKWSALGSTDEFVWRQTTYLGGLLQKVVVTRRKGK